MVAIRIGGHIKLISHIQYGRGQDIIFMHGWGGNKNSLRALAMPFIGEYRVTLVDFYGTNDTPHPNNPLSLEDFVQSIIDIIDHYRMTNVILVAHSFGGRVAIKLSAKYGHLLDRMVLLDSAGLQPRYSLKYYFNIYRYKIKKKLGCKTLPKGSKDYNNLSDIEKRTFVNIVNEHLDIYLPYITLPTLIIWGKNDKDTPVFMAKKFNKHIKNSKLFLLDGSHFVYAERTAECQAIIRSFLGDVYD